MYLGLRGIFISTDRHKKKTGGLKNNQREKGENKMRKRIIYIEGTCRNLKEMLEERKITPKEVQEYLGLESVQAVYKWLSPNNRTIPSTEDLAQLAALMNCDIEDILVFYDDYIRERRKKLMVCERCGAVMREGKSFGPYKGTLTIGAYWQGLDRNYGKSPIVWSILKEFEDGRILVISSEILDCKVFDEDRVENELTWEKSSIRRWLNETFINDAFSPKEQEKILMTRNVNHDNDEYHTPGGNDTEDKVFFLSVEEVSKYFFLDKYFSSSGAAVTKYAMAQGVHTSRGITGSWWLRTPGYGMGGYTACAATVDVMGRLSLHGSDMMNAEYVGVRPAIMLDGSKM